MSCRLAISLTVWTQRDGIERVTAAAPPRAASNPRQSPAGGTDQCIKTNVVYLSPHKLREKGAGTGPPFVAGVPTADDPTLSGKGPAVARDVPAWRVPWSPIGPRGSPHVGPHDESWQTKPAVQQPSPQPVPRQTH